jgi:hypothetical protein
MLRSLAAQFTSEVAKESLRDLRDCSLSISALMILTGFVRSGFLLSEFGLDFFREEGGVA